jgi:hypothetical protein
MYVASVSTWVGTLSYLALYNYLVRIVALIESTALR